MLHLLLSSGGGARRRRGRRVDRRAPAEDQQVPRTPPSSPVGGRPHPAAALPLAPHEPLPDRHRGGERRSPGGAPARVGTTAAPTSSAQPPGPGQAEFVICDQLDFGHFSNSQADSMI